jgi:beta-aspartyl-peptidase (threonine type)
MSPARRTLAGAALLLLAACATVGTGRAGASADAQREITQMMELSAQGWNRHDLDDFMVPYLDSPDITFVGSAGLVRGKAAIRQNYADGWFAPGRDPGRLSFRDIQVRMLGPDHALAVGRYEVRRPGRDLSTGLFSLTLRRTPQGWRIIHDHSS